MRDSDAKPSASQRRRFSPVVQAVLRRLHDSAGERLTLSAVSREVHRQPDYLGWLFRHQTRRTFHQRLTTIRLRRAARFIRAGEKIEAVAMLVGYQSKRNFYRQFRAAFHMSPGEYRERAQSPCPGIQAPVSKSEVSSQD